MFLSAQNAPAKNRELNGDGGGHWYDASGTPRHTTLSANGTERPTTKRDARKYGYLPSVTTITKVIANPSLDRWKQNQIISAAYNHSLEFGDADDYEQYAARVIGESQRKMVNARAFGSAFHSAVDELHRTGYLSGEHDSVKPFIPPYLQWVKDNKVEFLSTEFVAVNTELGYAGQVDAFARVGGKLTLLDYKTQDVKTSEGETPTLKHVQFYDSWIMQLAAYWFADWAGKPKRRPCIMSVVIPSNTPSYPVVNEWSREEVEHAWETFRAANRLWQLTNHFNPAENLKRFVEE